jgi:hypothetical protein
MPAPLGGKDARVSLAGLSGNESCGWHLAVKVGRAVNASTKRFTFQFPYVYPFLASFENLKNIGEKIVAFPLRARY